jgi:hypothetical protein
MGVAKGKGPSVITDRPLTGTTYRLRKTDSLVVSHYSRPTSRSSLVLPTDIARRTQRNSVASPPLLHAAQTSNSHTMAFDELRTVLSPLLSDEDIAIWITANSYVCLNDSADYRRVRQFHFTLTDTDEHQHDLSIHASTLEEAIICLDLRS